MSSSAEPFAARLHVEYPERLSRLTTALRLIWIIPIAAILCVLTASGNQSVAAQAGDRIQSSGGGIISLVSFATALMIVFRMRYPRWWFDFARELRRFSARVCAYLVLVTDRYPSTIEQQSVSLEIDYPDVDRDLNRWLPLVKWILALPHYLVLTVLWSAAAVAVVIAWFVILFTGRYPRGLFDFVVGVGRWTLRVDAYAVMLVTDRYPPFSLR